MPFLFRRLLAFLLILPLLFSQVPLVSARSPGFLNLTRIDEITSDKITGALDATMSVDNRVFSAAGRASIASDVENFGSNLIEATKGAGKGAVNSLATVGVVLDTLAESIAGNNEAGFLPMVNAKITLMQITHELYNTSPEWRILLSRERVLTSEEQQRLEATMQATAAIHGVDVDTVRAYASTQLSPGLYNSGDPALGLYGKTVGFNQLNADGTLAGGTELVRRSGHELVHPLLGPGQESAAIALGNFIASINENLFAPMNGVNISTGARQSADQWLAGSVGSEALFWSNVTAWKMAASEKTERFSSLELSDSFLRQKAQLAVDYWAREITYQEYTVTMAKLGAEEKRVLYSGPLGPAVAVAAGSGKALVNAGVGAFDFGILWGKSLLDPFTGWYPGAGEQFTKTIVFMPDNLGNAFHQAMRDINYGDAERVGDGLANLGLIFGPAAIGKYGELSAGLRGGGAVYYFDDVATGMVETGARQVISPSSIRAWDLADDAYAAIRTNKSDIATISENIDWPESRVARVKEHIFFKEHQLDSGVRRFDADPGIVNAWNRLVQGDHMPSDVNLMQHEIFESKFEGIFKTDYRSAHDAAIRAGRLWDPE